MKRNDENLSVPDKRLAAVCGLFCPVCSVYQGGQGSSALRHKPHR